MEKPENVKIYLCCYFLYPHTSLNQLHLLLHNTESPHHASSIQRHQHRNHHLDHSNTILCIQMMSALHRFRTEVGINSLTIWLFVYISVYICIKHILHIICEKLIYFIFSGYRILYRIADISFSI